MALGSLTVASRNVILPGYDQPQAATITVDVETGKIIDIQHEYLPVNPSGREDTKVRRIDAGDYFILPGLVDAHVHLNEPGRTDWEGFWTGTRAAVSGGITTVVDMPLNSIPPTTTVENLSLKRRTASGQCWTDVAFWGGVIPGNQPDLKPLVAAGVKGFKCFLIESGVEEFPCVSEDDLHGHMKELKDEPTVLLFHAELETPSSTSDLSHDSPDPTVYETFLNSRPEDMEVNAIKLITRLQEEYKSLRCHIVHLSASSALPIIQAARRRGLKLTVETCFHYLCLSSSNLLNCRPEFKCCPPIRDRSNRDSLWKALIDGDIDFVVSDHSPCVTELKKLDEGDIMAAWGGINSLGLGLSLLWTEGKTRNVGITQIISWLSEKTAEHAGLSASKGQLKVGLDGDLVIWDPNAEFKARQVSKELLHFKNKLSAYEGMTLRGVVQKTFLRGQLVYDQARNGFDELDPLGKLL
ncbi:allantoinase [Leucogyrophana mollusca]|uniref:Allantoinase n=1 Tax=Leucogyrophana mollusca TaxID=85980 RepID=A0ACB8BL08_9AGAM|nr:allantoinase [Leucogyrophana mollusca]